MTPFKVIVLFVFLSLTGVLLLPHFSIDFDPSFTLPKLTISYSLPTVPPEIIEQEVTAPLENMLSQIGNIKKIYSISSQEKGTIELTFDKETDLEFKKFEVSSIVRQVYSRLNVQSSYPVIEQKARENISKRPLLVFYVSSPLAAFQIKKNTDDLLVPAISQIKGVKEIVLQGSEDLQIHIDYDFEKLSIYKLSSHDIAQAIQKQFASYYPGSILLSTTQRLLLKVDVTFNNIQELENVLLSTEAHVIKLRDIAKVYIEESKPNRYFRINGQNSLTLAVFADDGVNRIELADKVKGVVNRLRTQLPALYNLELELDDTLFLSKEIKKNYVRSSISILILLLLIVVIYRDWRHLIVMFSGIIINLSLTVAIAFLSGISINMYTIAGVTISFGIMMDNLIMVIYHLERKKNIKIFTGILASTLSIVTALLMVILLPEEERQNLTDFSVIISIILCCSFFVAVFYLPAIYQLVCTNMQRASRKRKFKFLRIEAWAFAQYFLIIEKISKSKKTLIICLILLFGLPIFMLPSKWEGHAWYNSTIGSQFYQEKLRPYSDKVLGGTLRLFVRNAFERTGHRDLQRTQLNVHARLPEGHTLEEMNRVMRYVEDYLVTVQGIEKFITTINSGRYASIAILFDEKQERSTLPHQLKEILISRSLKWSGVEWNIFGIGLSFSNTGVEKLPNFVVEIRGYNYDELEKQTSRLSKRLLDHSRIQKVNTNEKLNWDEWPTQNFVLDFTLNQAINIDGSPYDLSLTLQEKTHPPTGKLYIPYRNALTQVLIREKNADTFSNFDVVNGPVSIKGKALKLVNYVDLKLVNTPGAIHKEDRQYIRLLSFDYNGTHKFGNEYLDQVIDQMKLEMPVGYAVKKIENDWDWNKTKRQYTLLFILMVAIYFICAITFESLKIPLLTLIIIPASFIGIFLTFGWFNFFFDQGGYAAFILLGGLIVNAFIIIVSDVRRHVKNNKRLIKEVWKKIRPVTYSILSTCLALVPFLRGQQEPFWFALSVGTIGGMTVSLLIITIVIPALLFKREY